MSEIKRRRGGRETPEQRRARQARYAAVNRHKMKARWTVSDAIKLGKMQRGPCEHAGPECFGAVHGHHDDYSRPLNVRWLCRKHHREADLALVQRECAPSGSNRGTSD